ncbi:MAG TPA: iron-containing alcohol dehydrogenase, partial [Candidatus Limnocylindria bacterium]|nr:iron-containing alcohol dehydrogenase [Candidatus Limnocylindria bacterium]
RVVLYGRGTLAQAAGLLDAPYAVLTTVRARRAAPELVARATSVHDVPAGRVDELAASLRETVQSELLVALGGGRVIDTAKALAAAEPPRRVAAIPTTLSGAEMTAIHRHAAGVDPSTPRVRPAIVINDPELSASQRWGDLAQSAANALGHAVEGPMTALTNPVARMAGLEAARLLQRGMGIGDGSDEARDRLALGALLAGYVIGSTGYGLHHVLSQTLVRFTQVGHGAANAIMLPHSLRALARRDPDGYLDVLAGALGESPVIFTEWLRERGGLQRLREVGVHESELDLCAEAASHRAELAMTPPAADRGELREMYAAAY